MLLLGGDTLTTATRTDLGPQANWPLPGVMHFLLFYWPFSPSRAFNFLHVRTRESEFDNFWSVEAIHTSSTSRPEWWWHKAKANLIALLVWHVKIEIHVKSDLALVYQLSWTHLTVGSWPPSWHDTFMTTDIHSSSTSAQVLDEPNSCLACQLAFWNRQ